MREREREHLPKVKDYMIGKKKSISKLMRKVDPPFSPRHYPMKIYYPQLMGCYAMHKQLILSFTSTFTHTTPICQN